MTEKNERNSFWLPLLVIVIGAFAAILNNSSVNVALPRMMTIFGVDADKIQWVTTAYMLTSGVIIPVTGYLGDRFGTKKMYIISVAVFTAGSVLCGLAWNNSAMIVARIIQGIGGGAIMPISMAIVYRIVPREKIGTALGIWGMAAVTAPAIGPTLGGYIIDHFNWRFLFTVNVPVGIIGIILAGAMVPESPRREGLKFDLWGFIYATAGCFTLLLALSQGHKEGWTSYYIVVLFIIAFYSFVLFTITELTIEQPMLNLRLLKNKVFTLSIICASLISIGLFGGVFLIPLFTQNILAMTPYQTGLLLMPAALVTIFLMPVSGFLFDRIGAKPLGLVGLTIMAMASWELHNISTATANHSITFIMMLRSIGMGLCMMPITTAGMNVVPRELTGNASALSNVIRQVAASLGIALLTVVMQNRQIYHYEHLTESVSIASLPAQQFLQKLSGSLGPGGALSVLNGLTARESLVMGIDDAFLVAALFAVSAIPLVFFLGKPKAKGKEAA